MLDAPEVDPHVHHKTGHSLADKILALLAVFLSCVSVFIAVHHGQTMERLVAANSWPNISYSTGNQRDTDAAKVISLNLKNAGVGPARIDTFEVFYKTTPLRDVSALLSACCGKVPENFSTSLVGDEVLPARETIEFVSLAQTRANADVWETLNKERFAVRVRVCYCSVFEECWVRDTNLRRPTRVEECKPSQPVQYR